MNFCQRETSIKLQIIHCSEKKGKNIIFNTVFSENKTKVFYSWFSCDVRKKTKTGSNHRLESAGLNALEELLFKMLGMSGEDSNVCFVCKGNWIFERPVY